MLEAEWLSMRRGAFFFSLLLALIYLFSLVFAATSDLTVALSGVCTSMTDLLPPVAMLMIVISAVVYGSGQIMGAETRARANVWATACMTGALMGLLITTVTPPILGAMYGGSVSCSGGGGTSGPACHALGTSGCASDAECCAGGCEAGTCCHYAPNGPCTANNECCLGSLCSGGHCCHPVGGMCSGDAECCSHNCVPGGWGIDTCQP